jgi:tRNA threonylcarbamoyladenosine biosynthesis protein TsaB
VERAAEAAGGWSSVERIAVGVGPGSFTGLRVGISSARALGASAGVPVAGVGTLDTLAMGLAPVAAGRPRLTVLDARRGEVFAAAYDGAGQRLWAPWVGAPEELGKRLSEMSESPLACGSGAVRFLDELVDRGAEVPDVEDPVHRVAARHLCAVAESGPGEPPVPLYLRAPDAERWRERDTSPEKG